MISSPFQFVADSDTFLRVVSVCSVAGVTLAIQGRRLDEKGQLQALTETHAPSSDRSVRTQDYALGVGAVLNLTVFASAGTPLKGQCYVMVQLLRNFGGTAIVLGTLLGAGVPLIHGLNVARKSIGNQILVDAVGHSIERVQQGGRLGESLADCKDLFPGSVLEMVSVGEESGKLDTELIRIANVTEVDLDRHLKTAVAFAEPVMLFLIAGFIGVIFIGMLLPVLTMSQNIK